MGSIAIADNLFREHPAPALIGGRHRQTGRIVFPCPDDPDRWEPIDLPRRGTLWSWTIQRFRPKTPPYAGPDAFEPSAVGYVELPGAVIVEAWLTGVAFDALAIGLEMELVFLPFTTDADGNEIRIYAFAPAGGNG